MLPSYLVTLLLGRKIGEKVPSHRERKTRPTEGVGHCRLWQNELRAEPRLQKNRRRVYHLAGDTNLRARVAESRKLCRRIVVEFGWVIKYSPLLHWIIRDDVNSQTKCWEDKTQDKREHHVNKSSAKGNKTMKGANKQVLRLVAMSMTLGSVTQPCGSVKKREPQGWTASPWTWNNTPWPNTTAEPTAGCSVGWIVHVHAWIIDRMKQTRPRGTSTDPTKTRADLWRVVRAALSCERKSAVGEFVGCRKGSEKEWISQEPSEVIEPMKTEFVQRCV